MNPKPKTPGEIEALARAVAPGLFAASKVGVPDHVREKWNALVEADANRELSPMDFCLLILRCVNEEIHNGQSLIQKLQGASDCCEDLEARVYESLSKLIIEGHITIRKTGLVLIEKSGSELLGKSV